MLDDTDIVRRSDGIRLTSPSRTLVDLTRYLSDESLASAIEHALSHGRCTPYTMLRVAEGLNTRGRPWVRRFERVLANRLPGQPRESEWEQRVHAALVGRGVNDIECQVGTRLSGYGTTRFDLAIPAIRMVIEVDAHPRTPDTGGTSERPSARPEYSS